MVLKRVASNSDGVYGVLIDGLVPFALTLERPWVDNEPDVSCIPDGRYWCHRLISPHFGETFEVMDVPGRSHILFHKGNTEKDSRGCILIGEQFGFLNGKISILSSKAGFNEFLARTREHDNFNLNIVWTPIDTHPLSDNKEG